MTNEEVERILGYTPCVCGVIDGTWHPACYKGLTDEQVKRGYVKAFAKAKVHIKTIRAQQTAAAIFKAERKV
jgi:hypothetical protein